MVERFLDFGTFILSVIFLFLDKAGGIGVDSSHSGTLKSFAAGNGSDFRQVLYLPDTATDVLYVGGREALYRLQLDNLSLIEYLNWEANDTSRNTCHTKGFEGCDNYVTVMLKGYDDETLFVCGSNAFDPRCTWRKARDLSQVLSRDDGTLKSPYKKEPSVATYRTRNGDMYFGSDFAKQGKDPVFSRTSLSNPRKIVRTSMENSWLDGAQFVEIFENGPFVNVFFRETAREGSTVRERPVYSRVARVCQWTTFQKARLECPVFRSSDDLSQAGGSVNYFDELQQITALNGDATSDRTVFAGIFNTPGSSIYGAALCLYEMQTIEKAFQGPYRDFSPDARGKRVPNKHASFRCETKEEHGRNVTVLDSRFTSDPQLMDESVGPGLGSRFDKPVLVEEMTLFKFLQAEEIITETEDRLYAFYILTNHQELRKYIFDPSNNTSKACLVAVWSNLFDPLEVVLTMKLLSRDHALILGTSQRVMKLSTSSCHEFANETECLGSGDPQCGWERESSSCRSETQQTASWQRTRSGSCDRKIFAPWNNSSWHPCEDKFSGAECRCRTRNCISSRCDDKEFQITNCSRAGGWSDYSPWGICEVSCKQRKIRTCTNPEPLFGGKDCQGESEQVQPCESGTCVKKGKLSASARSEMRMARVFDAPEEGVWQEWGPWSRCSKECGEGTQYRTRSCDQGSPNGKCTGSAKETQPCNMAECPDVKKVSEWTHWLAEGKDNHNPGSFNEHRFMCEVLVSGAAQPDAKVEVKMKHEQRFCPTPQSCHASRSYDAGLNTMWSGPSVCDGGLRYRYYNCSGSQQEVCGENKNVDETNPWSCWTDWSTCVNDEKFRQRTCLTDSKQCAQNFVQRETRTCKFDAVDLNTIQVAGSTAAPEHGFLIYLVIGCVLSFFSGMGVLFSIMIYLQSRKKHPAADSTMMSPMLNNGNMERQPALHNTYAPLPTNAAPPNGAILKSNETYVNEKITPDSPAFVRQRSFSPQPFDRNLPTQRSLKNQTPVRHTSFKKDDQYYQ